MKCGFLLTHNIEPVFSLFNQCWDLYNFIQSESNIKYAQQIWIHSNRLSYVFKDTLQVTLLQNSEFLSR